MDERLDLLLINPGGRAGGYQNLAQELAAVEPPLWVALLATYARNQGFSVEVLDAEAEGLSPADVGRRVAERKPQLADVVSFGSNPSASTQKMGAAGETCREIRRQAPAIKIMLAGLHPTALPERTMQDEDVDFVCQGEGPYTLKPLLSALRAGRYDLSAIPGLWRRVEGKIVSTRPAPLIRDLDADLPQAAWDLLPMHKYRAHNWQCFDHIDCRQPYAVIYTSLGCPFKCHFCCINALFGRRGIRYRGIAKVLDEIDLLVNKYNVRIIKILDELFVLKPDRIEQLCDELIRRDYGLNMWAYARVDTVNPLLLQKLRRAGVRWLAYGFESASSKVRDGVEKGFTDEQMSSAIEWTRQAGIHIIANYMVGLPDDTLGTMQQTLKEAKRYNFEFLNLYCAMAYPGSDLYRQAIDEGWALPETWEGYSQLGYATRPLPTKYVPAGEVLKFRDRAFVEYFGDPAYQDMIREKFGLQVVAHIKQMLQAKLARKYAAV